MDKRRDELEITNTKKPKWRECEDAEKYIHRSLTLELEIHGSWGKQMELLGRSLCPLFSFSGMIYGDDEYDRIMKVMSCLARSAQVWGCHQEQSHHMLDWTQQ